MDGYPDLTIIFEKIWFRISSSPQELLAVGEL